MVYQCLCSAMLLYIQPVVQFNVYCLQNYSSANVHNYIPYSTIGIVGWMKLAMYISLVNIKNANFKKENRDPEKTT